MLLLLLLLLLTMSTVILVEGDRRPKALAKGMVLGDFCAKLSEE